ncbi:MAG: phosphoribosylglycinamide formyltransferase [Pseudomonadota bacterium]
MQKALRVGVLISGRGSNLKALIDAAQSETFPAQIVCVLANRADAGGLDHARDAGIPAHTIPHKDYDGRHEFEQALTRSLADHRVDLVCLAGFMRLLSGDFVRHWQGRLINIHPSLLPAYKGLDVHRRMIEDAAKIAGCTVHYVTEDMDAGPIIDQRAVPILPDDTPDRLAARILIEEHILYPDCVRKIAEGKAPLNIGS